MADDTDMRTLARRYLDLWERQVADSATDPQAARAMAQWLALVNEGSSNGTTPPEDTERPEPSDG
jgi:hypothetical protein